MTRGNIQPAPALVAYRMVLSSGLILFAKNLLEWLPNAHVQYDLFSLQGLKYLGPTLRQ